MDKLLFHLKGIRTVIVLTGILSIVQSVALISQAWWLSIAITKMFYGHAWEDVTFPLLFFLASFVLRQTLAWGEKVVSGSFAEQTSETLQLQLTAKLMGLGSHYAAKLGSGKLVTLIMDGVVRFRTYVERFVPRALDMIFMTLPLLVTIYLLDLIAGLILTFTMPILIIFFILLGFAARSTADKQWRSYQLLSQHFTDTLRGLETLRFLGRSKSYGSTVERVSERYRSATIRTLRVAFLSSLSLDFFSTLSVAFVAVSLGLRLINGQMDLQPALAILLLAPEYFRPVRMLGSDYHASLDGKEAGQAIQEIMNMQADEMPSKAHDCLDKDKAAKRKLAQANLELRDIVVSGDESGTVRLSGITTTLDASKRKIGIVGASGAGKTTLLQVISGFIHPDSGMLMLNNEPLTAQTKAAWQRSIAYIPQQPYLFSSTLADNVRFYEPTATDEQVTQALYAAGLGELLSELAGGIHEQIGEGGRQLSGGQAQRVALARALVGKRAVWLFDEPTSHLDIETEWELKQTMLPLFEDRRVIIATHRLHWMQEMDWILVLDHGKLVEEGTHEQLSARKTSVYYSLLHASR